MGKHRKLLQTLAGFVMLLILVACGGTGSLLPSNSNFPCPELNKVFQVTAIYASVLESTPPQLNIGGEGNTRTGGWLIPQLVPYKYAAPPADGIYEFDFKAQPRAGIATQAITTIKTSYTMPLPNNLKGVKIYAEENNMIAMLAANDLICGGIQGKQCANEQHYCDFGVGQCKVLYAGGVYKDKPTISIDHPGECTLPVVQ